MAGKKRIVIKQAANKQKYAVIKSPNNKTLATTETYKNKNGVKNAVKAIKKVVKKAVVIDLTKNKKNKKKLNQ
jgi:uncharacterized protein YegP (UPF0339 family)